jgi:hypothetical protein
MIKILSIIISIMLMCVLVPVMVCIGVHMTTNYN